MKKGIVVYFLLFLCTMAIYAQEPLKHEYKVYVNSEGKVFINKNLPIYFRVSYSPDPNAESFVLQSEKTPKYSNPMYFDTEGRNTLRSPSAVDKVTKKQVVPKMDVTYEIYADGIAPVTNLKLSGTPKYVSKTQTYYGKGIKSDLTVFDATSGFEKTYISMNGGAFSEYTSSAVNFEKEQKYVLKYYSIDHVGNAEIPKTLTFQTDFSSPITNYSILGESKGNMLSSKASIALKSTDTLSGVDKIWYSINDKPFVPYTSPIPIMVLSKENSKITYYAVDKVGNKETPKVIATFTDIAGINESNSASYSFYIDKEPPVISYEIEGDQYKSKYLYLSERSRFKIDAKDEKSGVDKIVYSIDNLSLKNTFSDPFPIGNAGLHTIAYAANDYVGNAALVKTQQIYIDATSPVSTESFAGNIFKNRDTLFITNNTSIILKASDVGSGVQTIKYSIDQNPEETYNQPVICSTEGFHTFQYKAIDLVNNQENSKSMKIFVDNSAPQIITNFSTVAIGEKTIRDEKYTIYPSNVMLYIAATDNASGGERIEYQVNNNKQWLNTIPVKGFVPGNYEIIIQAYDVLKNKSVKTIRFAIEN